MNKNLYGLGLVGAMAAASALALNRLPERMPIHWGINGQVDGYAGRGTAVWIVPVIAAILWVIMVLIQLPGADPVLRDRAALQPVLQRYTIGILLFMAFVHGVMLANGLGWKVDVTRAIMAGVGVLFVLLGVGMGSLPRNSFAGIRAPWTISDETVWRKSHVMGGRIFAGAGALIVIAGLILNAPQAVIVITVVSLVMPAVVLGYSYWVAVQQRRMSQ